MPHSSFGHGQWSHPRPFRTQDPWTISQGWVEDTRPNAQRQIALERIQKYKPNAAKRFLAWGLTVVVGLWSVLGLAVAVEWSEPWDVVAFVFFSASIGYPGVFWIRRDRQDRQTMTQWAHRREEQLQMCQFLQGSELGLLSEPEPEPLLPHRNWWKVIGAQAGLFVLFIVAVALLG